MLNDIKDLAELRENIDKIDEQVVKLLAERYSLVKLAAKFKKTEVQVRDSERVKQVLIKVEELSLNYGLPPIIARLVYTNLINCLVEIETQEFKSHHEIA